MENIENNNSLEQTKKSGNRDFKGKRKPVVRLSKVKYEEKMLTKWRSNMVHFMDKLDDIRKTDWKATCPELYDKVKEWYNLPKGLF